MGNGEDKGMDDVVNQLAKELADAIGAAVADNAKHRSVPRQGARRGFRSACLDRSRRRLRQPHQRRRGDRVTTPARLLPGKREYELTSNDRRFLRSLRISCDEVEERNRRVSGRSLDRPTLIRDGLRLLQRRFLIAEIELPQRLELVVELVDQRNPVGMLSSTMSCSDTSSRYFTSARRLLPCAAMSTRLPAAHLRRDRLVPVGKEARHGVLQRLGERQL